MHSCLICKGLLAKRAFPYMITYDSVTYGYFKCTSCYSTNIYPLPDCLTLRKLYSSSYYSSIYTCEPAHLRFKDTLQFIEGKSGTFLDFGCGSADLLDILYDKGFAVCGVELNADHARSLDSQKPYSIYSYSEFLQLSQEFDFIHFGDVLEHLPDPADVLTSSVKCLAPSGYLITEGPLEANKSLVHMIILVHGWLTFFALRRYNRNGIPSHLFRASEYSQRMLFSRSLVGFHEIAFRVTENGWPYSKGNSVKRFFAFLARTLASILPSNWFIGNRFFAVHSRHI